MDTSAPTGSSDNLRDKLREGLRGLSPAYFGMAMATGIVSLSAHMQGWEWLATTLFWINASLYGVLWVLLLLRIADPAQILLPIGGRKAQVRTEAMAHVIPIQQIGMNAAAHQLGFQGTSQRRFS